ncbi:MAG: hypothetical protein R3C20_06115 [Planctomycetaceae bacterium]
MHEELTRLRAEFEQVFWPEEFIVEFTDGQKQVFVSSQGIALDDGIDDEGVGRPTITACWKKKSPSQQGFRRIAFFVDEVLEIRDSNGQLLWKPPVRRN